ncbi:MAG: RnfABCDGE type electron transport complex subunit D [Oscillospiraceae bacterium]|nr:RnfABCDGE type electron transport complex subunit D [Oscillospiraceae bacterium]
MKLHYSSSPHLRSKDTTSRLMLDVVIALLPALIVGIAFQGLRALIVTLISVLSAAAAEGIWGLLTKKKKLLKDGSAVLTGLLLAMTLPATVPLWLPAAGAVFAVIVVKALCGGLGQNIFNPALAARAFLMLLFPAAMTKFAPIGVDAVSSATALHHMQIPALPEQPLWELFLGNMSGTIGEVCTLALLAGGVYLLARKVITIRIPGAYLGTVAVLTLVFHKTDNALLWMLYQLCSGGVVLGAFFMATDYVTSPTTRLGQVIYGVGCGALTVIFRYTGLFPEGVTYAILLMNAAVWLLERYTAPVVFGCGKGGTK